MDAAFVDESHVAVPISPEFASIVASDMKDSIDAKLAGKRTKCDISQWHTLGKQARDMLAENSKHDRSRRRQGCQDGRCRQGQRRASS